MNTSLTSSDSEYDIKSLPDISTPFNFELEIIKEELERTKSILASANLEIENLLLENSSLKKKNMEYEKTISQLTCNNLFYGSQKSVSSVQKRKNRRSSILSIDSSKENEQDMLITTKTKLLNGQTDSQLSFHKCPLDGTTETTESKQPVKQFKEQKMETQSTHTTLEQKKIYILGDEQATGLATKLLMDREIRGDNNYKIMSFVKPQSLCADSLDYFNHIIKNLNHDDKIVIVTGANDSNPIKLLNDLSLSKLFGFISSAFENDVLEIHNEYRRAHGVPSLVLNKYICKISQKWAEELAKKDAISCSLNQNFGENVYCGWSPDPKVKTKARDCVEKWYSKIKDYSFGGEPEILTYGHYAQIVWKNTRELGVGSAKSKSGKLYVVANYFPPYNYSENFVKYVLPPGALEFQSSLSSSDTYSEWNILIGPPSPNLRSSKNLSEIATELVTKLRSVSKSVEKFEEEFLRAHNEYRRRHGVPPLELNKKLCKYAEEWAKILAKNGQMEHRDQNEYGENIYYAWSPDPNFKVSGRVPVDKWYNEINLHVFGREPNDLQSGHFSQVIWEDSRELGVGVAKSKNGQVYVVANYFPPGNIMGRFSEKVKPPIN
ncbi:unnamed protein product [Parnassius apollo]|uniref:(apollo) hypothetical protein n=1 Tax=Parnassius apollo TaxID=110799 RepID=A0A8S3XWT8_PARAO|nr:unnamed protein product [Parnassius apollo]